MCCGRKSVAKSPSRFKLFKPKQLSAQSLIEPIKKFLMCRPTFYDFPNINKHLASEQWTNLYDRIIELNGSIQFIKDQPDLPYMTFVSKNAFVHKDVVIISNFKDSTKKLEEEWFVGWFIENKFKIEYPYQNYESNTSFFMDNLISDVDISEYLVNKILPINLIDSRFANLNNCFCALNGKDYMIFTEAFDENSLNSIRNLGGKEIVISENEAINMACNSLIIGNSVIVPKNCEKTVYGLENLGYNVVQIDMSEFVKTSNGCKSLVLEIK